jgi:predicted nicotinamide N-methyase
MSARYSNCMVRETYSLNHEITAMLDPQPVNPPLLRSRDAGLAHARQHTEATEYGPARHLFDAGSGAGLAHGAPAAAETAAQAVA